MSNFHVFEDPIATDVQPASNPLPDFPPNPPLPVHYCVYCFHEKASAESSPDELLLATSTSLKDTTNKQNIGQKKNFDRAKKNGPACIVCREKQKRRNQA